MSKRSDKYISGLFVKLAFLAIGYGLFVLGVPTKVLVFIGLVWLAASLIYAAFKIDPPKRSAPAPPIPEEEKQ